MALCALTILSPRPSTLMSSLFTLPNLLSLSRVPLAGLMFFLVTGHQFVAAAVVIWTAVATDVLDGRLARRNDDSTALGGLLDHGSDALFVTLGVAALVPHGWAPAALVFLIPAAFMQYMLDSRALAGHKLRTSLVGRYNGVAYFFFAGWPVMQMALSLEVIPYEHFEWIGWGLVITTLISMADRAATLLQNRPDRQDDVPQPEASHQADNPGEPRVESRE